MSNAEEFFDPYEAHFHRDPLPGAAVRVVAIAEGDAGRAQAVAQALVDLLARRGRAAESVVVEANATGWGRALERGLEGSSCPVAIVTSAIEPPSDAHLDPLLAAIDHCDHVVGRRRASLPARRACAGWRAWPGGSCSPSRCATSIRRSGLHRLEKLAAIPLQSISAFLDVEILAKATFFGQLIDEVDIPALAGHRRGQYWFDLVAVFRRPVLVRPRRQLQRKIRKATTKVTTAQAERIARAIMMSLVEQPRPFEDHPAEGAGSAGSGGGPGSAAGRRRGSDRRRRRPPRGPTSAASPGSSGR